MMHAQWQTHIRDGLDQESPVVLTIQDQSTKYGSDVSMLSHDALKSKDHQAGVILLINSSFNFFIGCNYGNLFVVDQ